ncbi:MAG: Asp-tRNA(Asn)/Glu-tRNA(Gln) amidotransferase subunit GatA [Candidatus Bathyarchaeia archaeon]
MIQKSAIETRDELAGGASVEEYILSLLERIRERDPELNSFITVCEGSAIEAAKTLDRKRREGEKLGPLFGLAVAVKDNICTKGVRTTCGSKMLESFVPPYDATVIKRLREADAVVIGKTNMDEFAMGSSTENSHFGPTRNPLDPTRVPGGSSGGSAAAVAGGLAPLALGSDTGGSIRCPASFCSIVGLKPTYGAVSRYGLISYANSLEQIGPMASNIEDCELLFKAIRGYDPRDNTSLPQRDIEIKEGRIRIGVPKEFFMEGVQEAVEKHVRDFLDKMGSLVDIEEISLPSLAYALPTYYIIAMSEASSNLARYDGLRYGLRGEDGSDWNDMYCNNRGMGFGREVKRRIILGTYALSAGYRDRYYIRAQKIRTLIREDFGKAFKKFDLIAGPTMPVLPFKIGEKLDPLEIYMCDIETVPANLAGMPGISIPCGMSQGLPVGLQLIAPPFGEELLFRVGRIVEELA